MLKFHVPMRRDTRNILNVVYKQSARNIRGVGHGVSLALITAKDGADIDGQRSVVVTNLRGDKDYAGLDLLFELTIRTNLRDMLIALKVDPASDFEEMSRGINADYAVFRQLMSSPPKRQGFFGSWA